MNRLDFAIDTINHRSRVVSLSGKVSIDLLQNVIHHDQDKLDFCEDISNNDDMLLLWKNLPEGFTHHKSSETEYSKHHKENVDTLSGFIEMLCDWIDAYQSRKNDEPKEVIDAYVMIRWVSTIQQLDWMSILNNLNDDYVKLQEGKRDESTNN